MLPVINDSNPGAEDASRQNKRDEILDRIAASVSSDAMSSVRDESVLKVVNAFSKSLKENNAVLLETLVKEDKDLLTDTVKALSNLQGKTVEEFAKKLDEVMKHSEKMILRGEVQKNDALKEVGEKLKEIALQEKYKAMGIDGDPTTGQRVKERIFGKQTQTPDGTKATGWVQGKSILKNAGSGFASGFSSTFMGGAFAGVSKSNEERRREVREQTETENKKLAFLEESKQNLTSTLDNSGQTTDKVTQGGGEETTQLASANIAPDTKTKSDAEELRAGIRDTDPAFSRSSSALGVKDYWPELLRLLEEIKKCVCECQCNGSGMNLPLPAPIPVGGPVKTAAAAAIASRVPAAVATRVPMAVPALALASETAATRVPALTDARTAVARQTAVPQLTQQASGATLEELGLKTAQQEKVLVRRAGDVELSPKLQGRSVAEADAYRGIKPGLKGNELREAIRNRNIAEAAATAKVEPKAVVGGRDLNRRANENITTEEGRNNWRARKAAEMQEGSLSRSLQETSRTAPTGRNLVPVKGAVEATASKPWYSRAWESTKTTVSGMATGAAEKAKSFGTSALGAAKTAGSWIQGQRAKGAEALGKGFDWVKGKASKVFGGTAEAIGSSRFGKAAAPVLAKAGGLARVAGKAIPFLPAAIGAYSKYKETKARTGSTGRALLAGGITGLATYGGQVLGEAGGAAVGSLAGPVGTGVGFVAGGAAGAYAGEKAGSWGADKIDNLIWGKAEPAKAGEKPKAAIATPQGARQSGGATLQQRPRASVQGGQNQDSAIISRSTAAVATAKGAAEKPVINVPPPTVIQAPPQQSGPTIPHTSPHSRPDDNSWLTWQRRRTAAA